MTTQSHLLAPSAGVEAVIGQFLEFLARDIADHPGRLQRLDFGFLQRLQRLARDCNANLEATLPANE